MYSAWLPQVMNLLKWTHAFENKIRFPFYIPFLKVFNFVIFGVNISLLAADMTLQVLQSKRQGNQRNIVH